MLPDIENAYFLDMSMSSFNVERASVIAIGAMRCLDLRKNAVPTSFQVYVDTEQTLYPDVIAYNRLDVKRYNEHKVSPTAASTMVEKFFMNNDMIASFQSPDVIQAGMERLGVKFPENCHFIDLTYFITKHVNIKTDRWSPQGFSVPPVADALFAQTCFYGIVPPELWFVRRDTTGPGLERARRGVILTRELAQHYALDEMIRETENRPQEDDEIINLH